MGYEPEARLRFLPAGESQPFLGREITQPQNFSEYTAQRIDQEICRILEELDQRTRCLLEDNQGRLCALADLLLEQETVEGEVLKKLFETIPPAAITSPRHWLTQGPGCGAWLPSNLILPHLVRSRATRCGHARGTQRGFPVSGCERIRASNPNTRRMRVSVNTCPGVPCAITPPSRISTSRSL